MIGNHQLVETRLGKVDIEQIESAKYKLEVTEEIEKKMRQLDAKQWVAVLEMAKDSGMKPDEIISATERETNTAWFISEKQESIIFLLNAIGDVLGGKTK
jgi:hypothetical protein